MYIILLFELHGGVCDIRHTSWPRGGAGADPSWHRSGCGLNKLNSIYDFISCGEYLINEGFVHKNQLSAFGVSAGCLLVGAAVNMHPELFRSAILKVC